jgi:hypothetical protein
LNSGIRHPHTIATDGGDIRIAESGRIFGILGNPSSDGSVLSGSFDSTAAFAFDSVKITLDGGRVPPSVFSNYSFDFTAPAGTVFVI